MSSFQVHTHKQTLTLSSPTTLQKILTESKEDKAHRIVGACINGDSRVLDLTYLVSQTSTIAWVDVDSPRALDVLRHSTAHLLAQAIKKMYPKAKIALGPAIENGFYYDIDVDPPLNDSDLLAIESTMEKIRNEHLTIIRHMWDRKKAHEFFSSLGESYKVRILESIPDAMVSIYQQGDFFDLCRGPHLPNTSYITHFKLLSLSGAYFLGDEKNKMLQRIYGTAFFSKKDLETHLTHINERKERDHRKIGPALGFFTFLPEAPAMPFFLPKGAELFNKLIYFMRDNLKKDYQEVICPQVLSNSLWETSGHILHFKENMFFLDSHKDESGENDNSSIDSSQQFSLKPMNCPGHALLFASQTVSWRDLPLRYSEFSRLHRNEKIGTSHGLLRARAFSQDDAHIFCSFEHIHGEALRLIHDTQRIYKLFGFSNISIKLATRPENSMGEDKEWELACKLLEESLKDSKLPYDILDGEGAYYGPKIEFHIQDCIGRFWQCGTIQLDFNMPQRFNLRYSHESGKLERPIMIHRAILGSLERFMGILIENTKGHLPFWINPRQVIILSLHEDAHPHALRLQSEIESWEYACDIDITKETLGNKIRRAQLKKFPLILILGAKEIEQKKINIRISQTNAREEIDFTELKSYLLLTYEKSKGHTQITT